ncbi:MAG: NAD(P)-dependent oxidoreductase [Acidobacteriota bacterium]
MPLIENEPQLETTLATPSQRDIEFMRKHQGDVLILGAGGKMGPSLAKRTKRATEAAGVDRRVIAVSRFSSQVARADLEDQGVETIPCDLLDRDQVDRLPQCENVLFLAGRKFGSTERTDLTWATNAVLPADVARHFRRSRIVVFSTGNVYPFVSADSGGAVESDVPDPCGEYAQSCLGRERVFEYFSLENGTPCLIYRLNYAVDLRYGVLVDVARKVCEGEPVGLSVAHFNAIWQGDANSYALRSFEFCASPPKFLNVTGPEIISVRWAAEWFAERFKKDVRFEGQPSTSALLSNASLCHRLMGKPEVGLAQLMDWVAHWVESGGRSLNKPTHFEVKNGRF